VCSGAACYVILLLFDFMPWIWTEKKPSSKNVIRTARDFVSGVGCWLRLFLFTPVPSADKYLARPGRKQARKHVRDGRDFNKIETQAVIKFLFLQGKVPKEIYAILRETLAWFLPGRAKDVSAPLYNLQTGHTALHSKSCLSLNIVFIVCYISWRKIIQVGK